MGNFVAVVPTPLRPGTGEPRRQQETSSQKFWHLGQGLASARGRDLCQDSRPGKV